MTEEATSLQWLGMRYGELEAFIANLCEAPAETIRTRFRKLRLIPFPDEFRSGTGRRIDYDLPRILAIAAEFILNDLGVPQGSATQLVEAAWPELCRALLTSAVDAGLLRRPPAMPSNVLTTVRLAPRALSRSTDADTPLAVITEDDPIASALIVDGRTVLDALVRHFGGRDRAKSAGLGTTLAALECRFGWTLPDLPAHARVADQARHRLFLDEGPYFARARALLEAAPEEIAASARRKALLEAALRYLDRPAPVDVWKAEVGVDLSKPRLKHLISFWGRGLGLHGLAAYPTSLEASAGEDLRGQALSYLESAEQLGSKRGDA